MKNPFPTLDVDEIENTMQRYNKTNIKLKTSIANLAPKDGKDKVLEMFILEWKEMNQLLPIMVALGNKTLKPKHWKKIFELISPGYNPGKNFSFNDLLRYNILEKRE